MHRSWLFAFLFVCALSMGAAGSAPMNLDFENGAPGEVPPGWFAPTSQAGWKVELTADNPKQGKQSVRVSGLATNALFGNVMQTIDASSYRGARVRFRAAVRVEGESPVAALWMRVDRPAKQMGFFDNMGDRPIRTGEWTYYEIAGDIAPDAETLNIGMMLRGTSSAFLDDITIESVAKPPTRAAAARALTPRGAQNLVAFARLYGVVRYFHASDEAAAADWDAIAVNGADYVEGAKDANELVSRLEEVFKPVAPSVMLAATSNAPLVKIEKPANATKIVSWEHHGLETTQRNIYSSERVRRGVNESDPRDPDPQKPMQLDLGGGVSAFVPLAVYSDGSHTMPRATREARKSEVMAYTGNDRATRIGDVVIAWNVLAHFYPYFDVVKVDWPAQLQPALQAAATDNDEQVFVRTLRKLVAALEDGHGGVRLESATTRAMLPVLWRTIGDALIITTVDEAVTGVQPGDEVIAIDGKPAMQAIREAETLISASTPQWRRYVAQRDIAGGPPQSRATLTIRNADGSTREVTLARTVQNEPMREKRPEKIALVKPGIWYVDLDRVTDRDIDTAFKTIAGARGIVFDLRGYPRGVNTKLLTHLSDATLQSARWNIPVLRRPNLAGVEWSTDGRWSLPPEQPRFTKNIAFITDGRAISYAESWMGIVEAYKLATIVGEPTAGTNGNVVMLSLPGGYHVFFTGMKVLKHDGSRHHGVGIAPTVRVVPTIEGIRAGRDEQMEKAIELLEKK